MARYVDGFVIKIPKKNLAAYTRIAKAAGKIWMEHGALDYVESVGEDLKVPMCQPFTKLVKSKPGETVLFSFIVYRSRKHRDSVNKKVMADPRIHEMCDPGDMPFTMDSMYYGGFETLVDLRAKNTGKKNTAKKRKK